MPPPKAADPDDASFSHLADWFRLQSVLRWGGVYLDATIISLEAVTRWMNANDPVATLTGFYAPWATDAWRDRHDWNETWLELDMENSAFAAPAGLPLLARWRDNFAHAFSSSFGAFAASQPTQITGRQLRGRAGKYMAAYVALRQALAQLNATILVESGLNASDVNENDEFPRHTFGATVGTPAVLANASSDHVVRLRPSLVNHGPYAFEHHFGDPAHHAWDDCSAITGLFACSTQQACPELLVGTPLLKLRGTARACLTKQPVASIRPGEPSFLRDWLVAALDDCPDVGRIMSGRDLPRAVVESHVDMWYGNRVSEGALQPQRV